jgi:hypothetical protein
LRISGFLEVILFLISFASITHIPVSLNYQLSHPESDNLLSAQSMPIAH